ncbi:MULTISPECIES: two-component system sensor histidine kinase NtrB [Halocynthiibacter]|uniref:histidine kinase n=1 Tax=Halocynthiibacter halioticoli TaxID=2986804 RepID=A0AAE3LR97_9RHOB|nr:MULTISPECIES: ATP-binding protein [Halocynthiibacter]MCV6825342.1 ATP-binding protein [Halocynthiibacter halioticoli]MCW4058343.1 ATP-binding protein [Halocynthiibacter sp. SDUM655004]
MTADFQNSVRERIAQKKSDICNRWLLTAAFLTVIVSPIIIYRDLTVTDGLRTSTLLTVCALGLMLGITYFRSKLPLWVRAVAPIMLLVPLSAYGVSYFGMTAAGFYFLVIAPTLLLVCYGFWSALVLLVLTNSFVIGFAIFTVKTGLIRFGDPAAYIVAPASWANYVAIFVASSSAMLATVHVLNKFFTEALEQQAAESEKVANSERETRSILDQLVEPFFRVDTRGVLVKVSPSIEKLLNIPPQQIIGQPLGNFSPDPEGIDQFLQSVLDTVGKSEMEITLRRNDDTLRTIVMRAQPWRGPNEQTLGVEGVLVDITERRAAQKAIYHSRKVAASGLMAAGISHDFNNNLGVISGCLSSMEPYVEDNKDLKNLVDLAQRASAKASQLSTRLHQISIKTTYDTEPHDIDVIIQEFAPILFRVLPTDIKLNTKIGEGQKIAEINRSELEDVIFNLVGNARDAVVGGGEITIETQIVTLDPDTLETLPGHLNEGQYLRIAVEDTGKGVSLKDAARMFDPFYSTKPEGHGSGLGLSMVRSFAERAGGAIILANPGEEGARLELFLPALSSD